MSIGFILATLFNIMFLTLIFDVINCENIIKMKWKIDYGRTVISLLSVFSFTMKNLIMHVQDIMFTFSYAQTYY